MAVDVLGVPDYMTLEVGKRLAEKAKLDPSRLAITATHTHTAPMLTNCCPTIFGRPISPEEQQHVDQYTKELTDKLEQAALAALNDLKPAKVEWATGSVGFSINRRTPGGPVDHDMPMLVVRDVDGKIRSIYVSYACHCVTLSHNKISGDWAGYAAEMIEQAHPGAIALTSVGCGGDSNPSSNPVGDRADVAQGQGKQIADEVERLLKVGPSPITAPIATTLNRIPLAFDTPPTREQWEATAKRQDTEGYHARVNLARLDRGEKLQTQIDYFIQTWTFGDQLAMVFLGGEVVVDYSLRLKREFDRNRLWVNAYSNDVPCYIPSERILKEGGYEGAGAMTYYDRPTKLATGVEQKIIDEVHRQVPKEFVAPKGTEGVAPRSPEQSLQSIRTKPGLKVELVAAEPLVQSPVAIDWDEKGRLWVCEMFDYPTGTDGAFQPGGRVKFLTDTDGDGKLDRATIFAENIPFPTGVTAWGDGVYVCAAPDILFARDTDGDGKADKIDKVFTGFATENYQARVNSLAIGLDNWIYGANGLLAREIVDAAGHKVDIRNHDFRFRPRGTTLEQVTGLTQYGRVRDDFGNWFGCDNSRPLFHFPYEQRYLARNPQAPSPQTIVTVPGDYDLTRVFPVSRTLERFNDPQAANRFTSACGVAIYRDTLLGEQYTNNALVCEPVHNLVHRMILESDEAGVHVSRHRARDESGSEFFASSDNWSRFAQARTGPDGALYIVDMYRFLIEHPRWIPAERLAQIDIRAGSDKGRIYRVCPAGRPLRAVADLSKLNGEQLAAALNSPNGTERDRVHIALLARNDKSAASTLEQVAKSAALPRARVQALAAIDGLGAMTPALIEAAVRDADPHVRVQALRLAERSAGEAMLALINDPSPLVRRQLALSLGEWADPRAGAALAAMAKKFADDGDLRDAILSSASKHCGEILAAVKDHPDWIAPLVATAAASKDDKLIATALAAVLPENGAKPSQTQFAALGSLLDARPDLVDERVKRVVDAAKVAAADSGTPKEMRVSAISLLGRGDVAAEELDVLVNLVTGEADDETRAAAMSVLRRQSSREVATKLLARWAQTSPATRPDLVSLLLSRSEWSLALLNAINKHQLQSNEIALAERARLLDGDNADVKKLAAEVFKDEALSASRAVILERYGTVKNLTGSPAAGKELFVKNCAACHQHNGVGNDIGATLATVRGRDADYLVKNILDPSAVVEPRFVNYVVTLKDGRTLGGIIKAETPANVTLATGGSTAASIENIPRANIKTIRATSVSMMPDGFEAALSPQQLADVIAFIRSGSSPRKQLAGNTPELVKAASDGSIMLPANKAEVFGERIVFETEFGNLGYWDAVGDHAAWTFAIAKEQTFDVYLDYACQSSSAGNGYAIEVGGKTITGVVEGTGPDWSRYKQIKIGTVKLAAVEQRLTARPDGPPKSALMDLRNVALIPQGKQPHWKLKTDAASSDLPRDAAGVAKYILDLNRSNAARETAVNANPQYAAELIAEMTRDLQPDTPEEYVRIPWIWRVAIAAGKRNDADMIKRILDVSLLKNDQPLHDWQAVVIGGGIINGISLREITPGPRIVEIIGDDAGLKTRWQRSLDRASAMADNQQTPPGTRYDALRMLGAGPWSKRGEQLVRYLTSSNAELQMGAVSGLLDMAEPAARAALIAQLPKLEDGNRKIAEDGLKLNPFLVAVSNERSGDVTLIDGATNQAVGTIPVGKRPRGIAVSRDGKRLYVALSGTPIAGPPGSRDAEEREKLPVDRKADGIGIVDIEQRKLLRLMPAGLDPEQFALSADEKKMYVANEDAALVSVIDMASEKVTKEIKVGEEPEGMRLSPNGRFVWVTCETKGEVFMIDTTSDDVIGHLTVGGRPRSVAFSTDGLRAFVPAETAGTVTVINTAERTGPKTIKLPEGARPMGTLMSPDGPKLFVTGGRSQMLFAIDPARDEVVGSAKLGTRPWGLAMSPDGKWLYVANGPSNDVSVVNIATMKEVERVTAGDSPWGVAIIPNAK
jgi:putative membrane-bound dehydrogenase-like protein